MPLSEVSELSTFLVLLMGVMETFGAILMDWPDLRLPGLIGLMAGTGLSGGVGPVLDPLHLFRWEEQLLLSPNLRSHFPQEKGLSPVCVRTCDS